MRLAAKFTAALTAVIAAVLTLHAVLHVRSVSALYEREMRNDLAILARTLSTAAAEIWRTSGREAARAYVRQASERRVRTDVHVVEQPPVGSASSAAEATVVLRGDSARASYPVLVDGVAVATLEVEKQVKLERADLRSMIWTHVATTAALALVCAGVILTLGVLLVGRPVQSLIEQARRVGAGDFSTPSELRQRDEIGRLAQAMDEMAGELGRARERAQREHEQRTALLGQLRHADRLATVGKLASGIAHQLGTPLNVVSGTAAMIASGEAVGQEAADSARAVVEQARAMADTIRQLLDFSRRTGLQRRTTAVATVLEQAAKLLEPVARQRSVQIAVEPAGALEAAVDTGKTLQVLTNLIMNAIQAMPDGGTVRLAAAAEWVHEPLDQRSPPGEYVRFEVHDTGVGLPIEQFEHIFEPFFTTKGAGQGTGLGLSVCDELVREHGGWIDVRTAPGEGSCFAVYLPSKEEA